MDLELAHLRALAAAVDGGTFDAAARSLHITPSALSQRIKALETTVGRVLLTRSKPVQVTEAGAATLRLARQIDLLSADVARDLGGAAVSALPLAVNADSLATWVLPALAGLTARRPELTVEVHRDDQAHTTELLRSGAVVAAVTSHSAAVQGCTVAALGTMHYRACAASDFVQRWFADGVTPETLGRAPYVDFDRKDELQTDFLARRGVIGRPPRQVVPGSSEFIDAVRLGLGWGMVPTGWLDRLGSALVEIDPDDVGTDIPLYLQRWSLRTPALDAVTDAILAAAAAELRQPPTRAERSTP